jgi:hypothetical protein
MNLVKREDMRHGPHRALRPGDPWTFIYSAVVINDDTGRPVEVGDYLSHWFDTAEPGRLFVIVAIHGEAAASVAYETTFERLHEVEGRS